MGMIKSTADIVIENKAINSIILSRITKLFEELIDMFNKNPNKNTENVVNTALSLINEP